jgi:D-tyrosyl-tRNA(Tyr) deacylase
MRAVIQRVKEGSVSVGGELVGKIDQGLLVLLGVSGKDTEEEALFLSEKIVNLRIFEDEGGKMNLSISQTQGAILIVSQFTLYGDTRRGRRPSFTEAAEPKKAEALYLYFIEKVKERGVPVQTGKFGAMMDVGLINDGPVTLIVHSKNEVVP